MWSVSLFVCLSKGENEMRPKMTLKGKKPKKTAQKPRIVATPTQMTSEEALAIVDAYFARNNIQSDETTRQITAFRVQYPGMQIKDVRQHCEAAATVLVQKIAGCTRMASRALADSRKGKSTTIVRRRRRGRVVRGQSSNGHSAVSVDALLAENGWLKARLLTVCRTAHQMATHLAMHQSNAVTQLDELLDEIGLPAPMTPARPA